MQSSGPMFWGTAEEDIKREDRGVEESEHPSQGGLAAASGDKPVLSEAETSPASSARGFQRGGGGRGSTSALHDYRQRVHGAQEESGAAGQALRPERAHYWWAPQSYAARVDL